MSTERAVYLEWIVNRDHLGFVDEVEEQARRRAKKASEHPDDGRHRRSARALKALARWIRKNLEASVVLELGRMLDRAYGDGLDGLDGFDPTIGERLSGYGFDGPENPESWLWALVMEIRDHLAQRRSRRRSRACRAVDEIAMLERAWALPARGPA
jgi:hypothetical protein